MVIKKFGLHELDEIPLHTYAEAGRLDSFGIHAGDDLMAFSRERAWTRSQALT